MKHSIQWEDINVEPNPIYNFMNRMDKCWSREDEKELNKIIEAIHQHYFVKEDTDALNDNKKAWFDKLKESIFVDIYFGIIYMKFLESMPRKSNQKAYPLINLSDNCVYGYSGLYNWNRESTNNSKSIQEVFEIKLNQYVKNFNPINISSILPAIATNVFNTPYEYFHINHEKNYEKENQRKPILFSDIDNLFFDVNNKIQQIYEDMSFAEINDNVISENRFNQEMHFKYIASLIKDKASRSRVATNIETRINYNLHSYCKSKKREFEKKLNNLYKKFGINYPIITAPIGSDTDYYDWESLKNFTENLYEIDYKNNIIYLFRDMNEYFKSTNKSILLCYYNEMTRLPDLLLSLNDIYLSETEIKGFRTKLFAKHIRNDVTKTLMLKGYKLPNDDYFFSNNTVYILNAIIAKHIQNIDIITNQVQYQEMINSTKNLYSKSFDYIMDEHIIDELSSLRVIEFLEQINNNLYFSI